MRILFATGPLLGALGKRSLGLVALFVGVSSAEIVADEHPIRKHPGMSIARTDSHGTDAFGGDR